MSDSMLDEAVNKDTAVQKAVKSLSFDEKVDDLLGYIRFEPLLREIHRKILHYCLDRRGLSDIEQRIAEFPEFTYATRNQYALINDLANHHGLEFFELDAVGNPVSEADKTGLSENEIDDLVVGYAYRTTEEGKVAIQKLDPKKRLTALLDSVPERRATYLEILDFLGEKHSFAEVDALLRGRDVLSVGREREDQAISSSVFVDKLERAGGVVFDGGWKVTEEARELIAVIDVQRENER